MFIYSSALSVFVFLSGSSHFKPKETFLTVCLFFLCIIPTSGNHASTKTNERKRHRLFLSPHYAPPVAVRACIIWVVQWEIPPTTSVHRVIRCAKQNFLRKMRCDTLMFLKLRKTVSGTLMFGFCSLSQVKSAFPPKRTHKRSYGTNKILTSTCAGFCPTNFWDHTEKIGSSRTEASRYLDRTALCRTSSFVLPSLSLLGMSTHFPFCFSLLFPSFALVSRCIPFCFTLHSLRCEKNVF